jgi:hypothetical protein
LRVRVDEDENYNILFFLPQLSNIGIVHFSILTLLLVQNVDNNRVGKKLKIRRKSLKSAPEIRRLFISRKVQKSGGLVSLI